MTRQPMPAAVGLTPTDTARSAGLESLVLNPLPSRSAAPDVSSGAVEEVEGFLQAKRPARPPSREDVQPFMPSLVDPSERQRLNAMSRAQRKATRQLTLTLSDDAANVLRAFATREGLSFGDCVLDALEAVSQDLPRLIDETTSVPGMFVRNAPTHGDRRRAQFPIRVSYENKVALDRLREMCDAASRSQICEVAIMHHLAPQLNS